MLSTYGATLTAVVEVFFIGGTFSDHLSTPCSEIFASFARSCRELYAFVQRYIRIYKTIILPMVLYGCETWSLTLREEHRLKVFENRVLRRIFGTKRDEVTGEWRKLHN
jgi:hypothetical protein